MFMQLHVVARELDNSPLLPLAVLLVPRLPLVPLQHWFHLGVDALSSLLGEGGETTLEL